MADISNLTGAIFERLVIILPYKAPEMVKSIERTFERLNCEGLNLENAKYLATKELTKAEANNRRLDFMGGFEVMDKEFRMFVFEGLGGEGHAVNEFYKCHMRDRPNDKKFKMLYNPNVRFKNRLYTDFNVSIKKIRLRDTLSKISEKPDIYLRNKVPQEMYHTLNQLAEMRKLDRMALVHDFNLFPETVNITTLERKYGDSLSFEDLNGYK